MDVHLTKNTGTVQKIYNYLSLTWFNLCLIGLFIPFVCLAQVLVRLPRGRPRRFVESTLDNHHNTGAPFYDYRECLLLSFTQIYCWLVVQLSRPFISIELDLRGYENLGEAQIMVLGNHTSFLDTFVFSAFCPFSLFQRSRTIFDAKLNRIAGLGCLVSYAGHFSVEKDEEYHAVNAESLRSGIEAHCQRGGSLCLYPEGTMNRVDPSNLKEFRPGSFRYAIQNNMPIIFSFFVGNDRCWSPSSPLGGKPGSLFHRVERFGSLGSADYLKQHSKIETIKQDPVADLVASSKELASLLRDEMQLRLSNILSERTFR